MLRIKYRYFIYFFFCFFIHVSLAIESPKLERYPPNLASLVKVGDWVFRQGELLDSLVVRQLGGGDFSHIGVVVSVYPKIKIIHATTDDDPKHLNQVIESDFSDFVRPELAEKHAIARPNFLSTAQQKKIAKALIDQIGSRFELEPRKNHPNYCTTFIADAILKYDPNFKVNWKYVKFPTLDGYYLFPSEFAKRDDITWIYRYP